LYLNWRKFQSTACLINWFHLHIDWFIWLDNFSVWILIIWIWTVIVPGLVFSWTSTGPFIKGYILMAWCI
jgi:hypothetical protein